MTAAAVLSAGGVDAGQAVVDPNMAVAQDAFFNTVIAVSYATAALGLSVGAAILYWWAKGADPATDPVEYSINKLRGKKDDDVGPSV